MNQANINKLFMNWQLNYGEKRNINYLGVWNTWENMNNLEVAGDHPGSKQPLAQDNSQFKSKILQE